MFIVQIDIIKYGNFYWEDYHAGTNINDAKNQLKKYKEYFNGKVRLVKKVK